MVSTAHDQSDALRNSHSFDYAAVRKCESNFHRSRGDKWNGVFHRSGRNSAFSGQNGLVGDKGSQSHLGQLFPDILLIFSQFKEILKKLGVEEMEALGQPFDPQRHNAVMHIESEDLGENVVSQVFQAGFTLDGKVVRFAIVQVAN